MIVIVSPHLDDAVLSCGAALAFRDDVRVVTVFAGVPPSWPWPTPFDSASGFARSSDAVLARREEDRAACRVLRASPRHLPWLDGQYCFPRHEPSILQSLAVHVRCATEVVVPLGLAHPDHRLVAKLCRQVLAGRACIVYADLPSAKLWPSHVPGALRGWERAGYMLEEVPVEGKLVRKQEAVAEYRSQAGFPELAWENLTEERAWIATRSSD